MNNNLYKTAAGLTAAQVRDMVGHAADLNAGPKINKILGSFGMIDELGGPQTPEGRRAIERFARAIPKAYNDDIQGLHPTGLTAQRYARLHGELLRKANFGYHVVDKNGRRINDTLGHPIPPSATIEWWTKPADRPTHNILEEAAAYQKTHGGYAAPPEPPEPPASNGILDTVKNHAGAIALGTAGIGATALALGYYAKKRRERLDRERKQFTENETTPARM